MRTLCVDLAAKFSAWQVRDGRQVDAEGDSRGMSAFEFAKKIRQVADVHQPDIIVVEHVPPNVQYGLESIFRLQGVLMAYCHPWLDRMVFLMPQTWQKAFPGVGVAPRDIPKGQRDAYRQERAREHAAARGYHPPDLVGEYIASLPEGARPLKKNLTPLAKNMTDYVDAFLIGEWVQANGTVEELRRLQGVQPPII